VEPIEIPIDGVLDLHTFQPKEVKSLLTDYFEACLEKGILSVRVIHGKGQGILKKRVQSVLRKDPDVEGFFDAPIQSGGWGATLVRLKQKAA